jgi:uncharacterized protein (DUF2336 family)
MLAAVAAPTQSLIPELEDVVQHGTPARRAETLRRVTTLFLDGAPHFGDDHVALFDDVIGYLIDQIEAKALAELARRIAPVPNAPPEVVRMLAVNDDITVAGPVLAQARIHDGDLQYIAEHKSQAHLLAMSTRQGITEALTDILVTRGNRDVACSIADNQMARLSPAAFASLVQRAGDDGVLAEKVGLRTDIPSRLFRQLLIQATEIVQQRLLSRAKPDTQAEIRKVLAQVSQEVGDKAAPRSYATAMQTVRALNQQRKLTQADVLAYAKAGQYDETIAALATMCTVPVEVVDRLMGGERFDPVLILGRSADFSWETVHAIVSAKPDAGNISPDAIKAAKDNFDRLTPTTAQRVVRFWQVRQGTGE